MYLYLDVYLSVHIYTHLAHVAYATTVVLRSLAARPAMGDDTDPEAQVIESHTSVQDGRLSGLQWRIPACSNPVLNKNLTRRTILKPVRTSRRTEAWALTQVLHLWTGLISVAKCGRADTVFRGKVWSKVA